MVEMEKALLKKLCRDNDLYVTPAINDKLYLHYKGFRCIKNLDEYTGLKVLWLEGNGLPRIQGLEHQTLLKTLYLQENLIQKIENLEAQRGLDTLNLSQNQISRIENLGHMAELTSLSLKSNYLATAQDIEHVLQLPNLAVLDVQSNRITDPDVLEVFAKMPSLKVLYLQGNDVVKHIKQYRKTLIYRCRKLKYLDDRPVFDEERRRVEAWGKALDSTGDFKAAQEAEREEMDAIRQEKKDRDRLNFLHFEQLMAEGRRKKREDEERRQRETSNQQPEPEAPEINPFSGEKIVPVQDCEFLQRQREERWERVVNEPEAWKGDSKEETTTTATFLDTTNTDSTNMSRTSNQDEANVSGIAVDARRLEILHQCATVGSCTGGARDAFVEATFQVAEDTAVAPPLAPASSADAQDAQRDRVKRLAKAKVDELRAKKHQAASEPLTPATQLIGLNALVLNDAGSFSTLESAAAIDAPLMPPPAPVQTRSAVLTPPLTHTNVDELD